MNRRRLWVIYRYAVVPYSEAITNNRIISIDNGKVTFTYRDRQDNNEIKTISLTADEFMGRFLLHEKGEKGDVGE